ncbi:MAG: SDR family NAD(P)-dependent oxidoreductase [Desulfosarcinaceae bacterium]|nr:SDR family NAD(P)-dependent oxidoreductase [Desulfosarcinaceae bacterium]
MNEQRFTEKYGPWALVTGASSGLGRELAYRLGAAGLNLILQGRDEVRLQAVSERLTTMGAETVTIPIDFSKVGAVDDLLAKIETWEIGCFVGAAGYGTSGAFIRNAVDDEADMVDVNCRAVVKMTHHFARRFTAQKRGGIILFGSLVGFQGTPFASNYAATKAYIQILGEGLHHELKPNGVDVLCVAPGPVATGFGARADMQMEGAADPVPLAPVILKALGRKTTVKPGFLSKFLLFSLALLPRWGRIMVMANVMGNMTKHQS